MNEEENVPLVPVSLESNDADCLPQNVLAEFAEVSELMKIFWSLIISFIVLYLGLSRVKTFKDLDPIIYLTEKSKDKKLYDIPFNQSILGDKHVFSTLSLDIIPYTNKNTKPTGFKIRTSATIASNKIRFAENRISHKFSQNNTRYPVFYTNTGKSTMFNLTITCQSNRDWAEKIIFYWKVGLESAFIISNLIHGVLFVLLSLLSIKWYRHGSMNTSTRAKSVVLLLSLAIISQFPYEIAFEPVTTEIVRQILSGIYFCFILYYWRLKSARFNFKKITGSGESRSMIIGGAMMAVIMYKIMTSYMSLYSLPTSSSGEDPSNADFLAKNLKELLIAGFFYFILIDLLDTSEKMATEDSQAYLADNSLFLFSTVFGLLMFLRKSKETVQLPNPIQSALSDVLWILPLIYEVYASSYADEMDEHYVLNENVEEEDIYLNDS